MWEKLHLNWFNAELKGSVLPLIAFLINCTSAKKYRSACGSYRGGGLVDSTTGLGPDDRLSIQSLSFLSSDLDPASNKGGTSTEHQLYVTNYGPP